MVDDLGGVAMLRSAKRNDAISAYDITGLLWREELDEICLAAGIKSTSKETKKDIRAKVAKLVPVTDIRAFVLCRLKARKSERG
ncbi:hypothetical protein D9M71_747080 [compost metagenome]